MPDQTSTTPLELQFVGQVASEQEFDYWEIYLKQAPEMEDRGPGECTQRVAEHAHEHARRNEIVPASCRRKRGRGCRAQYGGVRSRDEFGNCEPEQAPYSQQYDQVKI